MFLDTGYELTIPVIINQDSGVLFTLTGDVKSNKPIKFATILPRVSEAAITLYLYLLRGRDTSKVYIVDRATMVDCLNIFDFTGDNELAVRSS